MSRQIDGIPIGDRFVALLWSSKPATVTTAKLGPDQHASATSPFLRVSAWTRGVATNA
jgi:hypothetical protein